MAHARNRVVLFGKISTIQGWSTGVDLDMSTYVSGLAQLNTWANTIMTDLTTNWGLAPYAGLKGLLGAATNITRIQVQYLLGGTLTTVGEAFFGTPLVGSGLNAFPQLARVITHRSDFAGKSYRGRSYWPGTGGAGSQTNGTFTTPSAASTLTAIKALYGDFATTCPVGGAAHGPAVYSGKIDSVTPVTHIATDDVMDTQRRRRDKIVGTTTTVAWP